jgi:hypothetical protein
VNREGTAGSAVWQPGALQAGMRCATLQLLARHG